jgi:hypothetical protein
MPPRTLPPSEATDADSSAASHHIRVQRRIGSVVQSVVASIASDSNETASNIAGPGLLLGQLFSAAGRRLDVVVDRAASRVGLSFEGIARRLLMKIRSPHSRCRAWPEFSKTPVFDLAIELGTGRCAGCQQRYMRPLGGTYNREVEKLLLRLVPSIE